MSIIAPSIDEMFENFKVEYPFLDLVDPEQLKVSRIGKLLVVVGDVKTSPKLPIPEKVYNNFVIGIIPERRSHIRV